MRTRSILAIVLLISTYSYSQEPVDALRYSWTAPGGTARMQAIGGATTALGGDITSTFTNPAGLGMYKTNEFVISPGFRFLSNNTDYRGNSSSDSKSSFNYGTSGFVFGLPSSGNRSWKGFSFSLALNRTANFNNNVSLKGTNNQSSYSEKYLEELVNNNVTDPNAAANNYPYGASLAFNTFLVDTMNDASGQLSGYRSLATVGTGLIQEQKITTKGGISDFAFGGSANYMDKLYFGGSIGISMLNYERTTSYTETDATNNPVNDFNYFISDDYLKTSGVGININAGIIFKPVEFLRLGLSFHSPTWYQLKDQYSAAVTTDLDGYGGAGIKSESSTDFNNGQLGEYNYNYTTPWRAAFGISYVFREDQDTHNQKGFISADVEYINYTNSSFKAQNSADQSDKDYFTEVNGKIDEAFKSAVNFRLGGELKFNTFMVRAGYSIYTNPYTNSFFNNQSSETVKANHMNVSAGLGWRDKGMFVDLTGIYLISNDAYFPYRLDQGVFNAAKVKSNGADIFLTIGFKF